MSLHYYIDSNLPAFIASDLVILFERLVEKCPSDALLSFCLFSVGGRLCMDVTVNSTRMRFKESIESSSYPVIKRALEKIFKARVSAWRANGIE